ncbi:MAG: cyanophycinase [Acidobacteria bacterium]|nr:cyanophycinase [Acidobacteriota bacterium]
MIITFTAILITALTAQQPTHQYFLSGNPANVDVPTQPGFLMLGGSTDVDEAFRWFLKKAGHGDIVVLRASGADGYNPYLMKLAPIDSVETILFRDKQASYDPTIHAKLKQADAIFLAGGDQWNYFRYWKDTPIETLIHEAAQRGVPIGGTSAGLAVLGQFSFTAKHDTVTSPTALANPYDEKVDIDADFLEFPQFRCLITDSHFSKRERMGRLLVFMARIRQESPCTTVKAIAIDERTAVLYEPNGQFRVVGSEAAFFLTLKNKPNLKPGQPATIPNISVQRIPANGATTRYKLAVHNGTLRQAQ